MKNNVKFLARAGMIAALYIALTAVSAVLGLASGAVQVRISEALCVLPVFTAAAIPGVTVGCLLSNILFGGTVYDILFGTLATLVGAVLAWLIRRLPMLASVPTILSNAVIIPVVLILSGAGGWNMLPYFIATVALGEIIACGVFGTILVYYLRRHPKTCSVLFRR
ncbi:MAG: QueT transporter family protein [Clostridia bacterium]|nr:QueT transporter family protein [Clostridia bacterium]MBQ8370971.1 QueT transporter family protein [Clostridia bacterium]MBQ8512262.1 QueT transporter family protein [Clostridia bacterium]